MTFSRRTSTWNHGQIGDISHTENVVVRFRRLHRSSPVISGACSDCRSLPLASSSPGCRTRRLDCTGVEWQLQGRRLMRLDLVELRRFGDHRRDRRTDNLDHVLPGAAVEAIIAPGGEPLLPLFRQTAASASGCPSSATSAVSRSLVSHERHGDAERIG